MSRTDHARKPRFRGHRVEIRQPRTFDSDPSFQAVCSCGVVGRIWTTRYEHAANERAAHLAEQARPS